MGTNYYLYQKPACPHCGHQVEPLHIGKSSAGWCFALHVIPGVANNLLAWDTLMSAPGAQIRDEYGDPVTHAQMLRVITQRARPDFDWTGGWWLTAGYATEAYFHERNSSRRGPNGLLRARIDGRHCVGHGDGTWDYIAGEFS